MNGSYKVTLLLLAAVLLAGMALFAPELVRAFQQRGEVAATFASYSDALVREDWHKAYAFSGPEFREAAPFENFVGRLTDLEKSYGRLRAVEQKSLYVRFFRSPPAGVTIIGAEHHYERGVIQVRYEFHYHGGRWLLYGFVRE